MKTGDTPKQQRNSLFRAAGKLKHTAFWDATHPVLFAFREQDSGETHFCTFTNLESEGPAFTLFRGVWALSLFDRILSGEITHLDFEYLTERNSLQVLFSPALDHPVGRSNESRRKSGDISLFIRSCRPGYLPWKLNPHEVPLLTTGLELARQVLKNHTVEEFRYERGAEKVVLFVLSRTGEILEEKHVSPSEIDPPQIGDPPDELRLFRIKRRSNRRRGVWMGDFFYIPAPRDGEEGPYFPMVFLWVEEHVDHILTSRVTTPARYRSEFRDEFLSLLDSVVYLPSLVLVKSPEVYFLLEPIARFLGFGLELRSHLPLLESQKGEFFDFSAQ